MVVLEKRHEEKRNKGIIQKKFFLIILNLDHFDLFQIYE